jgi:hypothetical protein
MAITEPDRDPTIVDRSFAAPSRAARSQKPDLELSLPAVR